MIGDNNAGKTTVFEAIDLVLGPDRLNRRSPIDEHDFYLGKYLSEKSTVAEGTPAATTPTQAGAAQEADTMKAPPKIAVEVTVTDLSEEQQARFADYIEW